MGDKNVVTFPGTPREIERIERCALTADREEGVEGYVVMIIGRKIGMSFKFSVPENGIQIDQMTGAIERIKLRLMQHNGELGGR